MLPKPNPNPNPYLHPYLHPPCRRVGSEVDSRHCPLWPDQPCVLRCHDTSASRPHAEDGDTHISHVSPLCLPYTLPHTP